MEADGACFTALFCSDFNTSNTWSHISLVDFNNSRHGGKQEPFGFSAGGMCCCQTCHCARAKAALLTLLFKMLSSYMASISPREKPQSTESCKQKVRVCGTPCFPLWSGLCGRRVSVTAKRYFKQRRVRAGSVWEKSSPGTRVLVHISKIIEPTCVDPKACISDWRQEVVH